MAKAELSTLPVELREDIWMLALLPEPGVYHFDPDQFTLTEDKETWEDERWMIPKRKYPTAMHVCQESRRISLRIMEEEQKQEQEDGTLPYYCLGSGARPFNPNTDTFWFSQISRLDHPWVACPEYVIGKRIHTIKNLALSSEYINSITPGTTGNFIMISGWDTFRWHKIGFFVSLRRVDVVFGATWVGDDRACESSSPYVHLDIVPELRLEKWTEGSSTTETLDEVETKIDKVRTDVIESFQFLFERMEEDENDELPLPEGAPGYHDASKITFHAAKIVQVRTLQNPWARKPNGAISYRNML